ncbi:glycosyltransferase family 4 protein [Candidatus Falkowbacteria bacterium]|nr:glycosyltransferase family 4 protein [Candidatus Falkowbacteria bacterium]
MNVAIDIRCLLDKQLTGVGEYTFNLLSQLFSIDKQNQYYLFYNSYKKTAPLKFAGENVHYCGFNFPNKLLNLLILLFKTPKLDRLINKKFNVSVDFFFFPNINFISTDCPYIITGHDLTFSFLKKCFSPKSRAWHKLIKPQRLFQRAKKIIAVSENTKRDLISIYNIPKQQISTIYSGIATIFQPNLQEMPTAKRIKNKYQLPQKFILYLGTIEPRKNIETLISAFELFKKSAAHKNYSLVLAGKHGWQFNKIEKQIKQSAWRDTIKFIDYVAPEDKPYLYNLAEIFAYPSLYEGFGFPVLEAMACGRPVITSHASSLPEICENAAIYIDPNNINDLARAMASLVNNPQQHLTNAGLAQAAKFSWQSTAQQLLTIFKQL